MLLLVATPLKAQLCGVKVAILSQIIWDSPDF